MQNLNLKPTHAPVKAYYQALGQYGQLNFDHEMAVRSAFQHLLEKCGSQFNWTLIAEYPLPRPKATPLKVDGALVDEFRLKRGLWEAKDEHDNLEKEVKKKITAGYPTDNIIFQAPERAILYQNGIRQGLNEDISNPDNLVDLLHHFFEYRQPQHEEWEAAVAEFKERLPEIAAGAKQLIEDERRKNPAFVKNFEEFYTLCRQAINPNLTEDTVEGMLIQHLLTERIFRKIFDNPDFSRRNVIAQEIEKVITSLTSRHFNRDAFLQSLDRFYKAIETNADNTKSYSDKQEFLNTVYERFFHGYSPKEADTHGVVYTPQPIVDFMVQSVEEILGTEFGRSLSNREVHILDPFVGTGNFITRVMREIRKTALPYKYEHELHCNELMLMPYYISSMNIEHAYLEATGEYKPFPGICLVDTFELAEARQAQLGFMAEENAQRVKKQKDAPIFVIIGNPPYNSKQMDESDQNQNRTYPVLDARIAETYTADSVATLRNKLSDPYVRAIRWASDRIGQQGLIAFVTNASYIDQIAFDGMRKHLAADFDAIYVLGLGGNVRKNPKLSGSTHNVFGIQIDVAIAFFVKTGKSKDGGLRLLYSTTETDWTKEQKYKFLSDAKNLSGIKWRPLKADTHGYWLLSDSTATYLTFVPLGDKTAKRSQTPSESIVFQLFSLGVASNRDAYAYNFNTPQLRETAQTFIEVYTQKLAILKQRKVDPDSLIDVEDTRIKWTRQTKAALRRGDESTFKANAIRTAVYRPFTKMSLYFDDFWNEEQYRFREIFPTTEAEQENIVFCATGPGAERPFACFVCNNIPDLNFFGPGTVPQWFPFFTYDEDGKNRRENITDWALEQFRSHYQDSSITKLDIFHYAYAILHHTKYREGYGADLRRELPRIPFAPEFRKFVAAGEHLSNLHLNYEKEAEYPLEQFEKKGEKLDLKVERMRLTENRTGLLYNDFLRLKGIPPEVFEYRLGNRSALEWVIDQYQVSTDNRSGIVNDPNRADDPDYILRLIGKVITVSVETVKIVRSLPSLGIEVASAKPAAGL